MNRKTLAVLNTIFFAVTIAVNYLSNSGLIGGNTMRSVSNRYENLFTPASYAFSIWGVIYLLLGGFIVYSFFVLKKDKHSSFISDTGIWFILSCIANSLWVVCWLNDFIGLSVLFMLILLTSLTKVILNNHIGISDATPRQKFFLWWPFSLYAGWISVATIANIAAFLTKTEWTGFGISETVWTIIMIAVAAVLNLILISKRDITAFAIAGAWGLMAVAIANRGDHQPVFLAAIISSILIIISVVITLFKKPAGIRQHHLKH